MAFQGIHLDIYSDILSNILSDSYSDILLGILCDIYSDFLSRTYSDILSDMYSDILSGAVRVRRGPLWSGACCAGPAGTNGIRGLLFGSGVLFGPGGDQSAFCSGSAATNVISSLQLRPGGGGRNWNEEEGADIKSSNPHLTGGGKMVDKQIGRKKHESV